MARSVLTLAILATLLSLSGGPKDDAAKVDKERIQGTWKWESVLDQGKEQPSPEENRLVITSHLMKIVYPKDDAMGWKYTVDPSKEPKEMDWVVEIDPGHPIRQLAIYSLNGDTLRICSTAQGKPRPTKFESKKGDFGALWVLKRVGPPGDKQSAN